MSASPGESRTISDPSSCGCALLLPLGALAPRVSSHAQAIENMPPEGQGACYPVPRRDSH
jgi:hypothetical protein